MNTWKLIVGTIVGCVGALGAHSCITLAASGATIMRQEPVRHGVSVLQHKRERARQAQRGANRGKLAEYQEVFESSSKFLKS